MRRNSTKPWELPPPQSGGNCLHPQPLILRATGESVMRMLLVIVLLALLGGVGYFAYAGLTVPGEPMPDKFYVALALGTMFSLVIGVGLMALLFFSSRRGYDEPPRYK
jgi:hypothetical protein